ncbi:hypothetical protein Tco_1353537 [Tanacetum coccineum]
MTKTRVADYGIIKWIEDLFPHTMWSQVPVSYDKHALWGISHWGRKRQQFYGFVANKEYARDVYSKHDDKLYKFKEGDFNRLRIQDIEDLLLLFVQGKLNNLNVKERLAFNFSLRMFTRSVVIQRHVEDLQLGVKSYQKKLNLTKPDTYRSDVKRREAYIAYSNPRGFIYHNKDKKNRLMRIDEQHKFSDGTLNDVRTALDDHLKGIRMKFDTSAGNPVNEFLLKLNLPDHRSILTDSKVTPTKHRGEDDFPISFVNKEIYFQRRKNFFIPLSYPCVYQHTQRNHKVKVREEERTEGEARLLDSTVGRVVPFLPVALARAERVRIIVAENVTTERPKHPRKKRHAAIDDGGSSHPPKKLSGLRNVCMLNVKAGVATVTTLPMVTSSVSATPEHESGPSTDSITGLNLRTLGLTKRFVISSDSSHHSSINDAEAGIDSFVRSVTPTPVMTEAVITTNVASIPSASSLKTSTKVVTSVHASMFHDYDSTGTVKPATAGSSYVPGKELSMGSLDINSETFHELLLKETEAAEAVHLRAHVSAAEAAEKMHASEIDALKQKNVALENKKGSLDGKVAELQSLVSTKDLELKELSAIVHELETTCSGLRGQVLGYDRLKEHIEEFQDAQMNIVNDKVAKLDADLLEMALHLEDKFYPHLLNIISGRSRAIEKGMQDGLSASIDHGKTGRSLEDVTAYNPSTKADYTSAFQRLREVDFPLLAELKSHKDASTTDVIDLLRLEGPFADAPGISYLQPNIKQLKLPIYRPEDQVIIGENSLLVSLDVTHSCVERIRENVAAHRPALIGVWTPLVDPLYVENLVGVASTSGSMPATVATTTALSLTFASASTVPPITIEDYEIIGTDVQGSGQGEAASFPNTVEFEKEELDTTPECDPPS